MPPTPPSTVTATQTAVFKLRSPSAWKRAAILDAMERTHLATEAAVGTLPEHFECVPLIVDTSDESLGGLHETGSSPAATKTWFSPGRIL